MGWNFPLDSVRPIHFVENEGGSQGRIERVQVQQGFGDQLAATYTTTAVCCSAQ